MKPCPPPDPAPKRPSRATLPAGTIDTHGHIFGPNYPWNLQRGYTPPDALPEPLRWHFEFLAHVGNYILDIGREATHQCAGQGGAWRTSEMEERHE